MDRLAIERSITPCHEILEQHHVKDLVLVGIHKRGVPLAGRIETKYLILQDANLIMAR